MTDLPLASSAADASAATAIEQHHAEMAGTLAGLVGALLTAAAAADPAAGEVARGRLVRWCREELLPHAAAEEKSLYPAAHVDDRAELLIDAMIAEHGEITGLVDEIAAAPDAVRAAAAARALQAVFAGHLRKENEIVVPLLGAVPGVSLADLLSGMHEVLGGQPTAEEPARPVAVHGGRSCGCHEAEDGGYPELDARAVPHAIRHATVFGALESVPAGRGLVLVAPHDPRPLLAQIEQRWPGVFAVSYLQRGPEAWRLSFTRGA
jgi:uncharacterized protein (DUF2249 family)/iron-sulfur cluster repair protein YtfE (RIC family)